jgi:ribosomal protein S18 acetylase RimI-like enzyme
MVIIRPTLPTDYAEVNALGNAHHLATYNESDESFNSKMAGYPEGCFVAELDGIVGYLISFPYTLGRVCLLNEMYGPVQHPDCYYIHDVCVLPDFRGMGIARKLAERVLDGEWNVVGLVAVAGSGGFWRRLGFRGFAAIEYAGRKAEYMLRIRD